MQQAMMSPSALIDSAAISTSDGSMPRLETSKTESLIRYEREALTDTRFFELRALIEKMVRRALRAHWFRLAARFIF